MKGLLVLIVLGLVCRTSGQSVLDWIFGVDDDQTNQGQSYPKLPKGLPASGEMIAKIPFELKSADEKFLDEAMKYGNLELSELDVCHHRLILQLKSKCSGMSEEDISKLSVNLLNCQSYVEGRPIYPCSKHMSLQECTQSMDQNTWNAYHIVSSRARSICYSARQQQFRASAEITVSKLAQTAREQLEALKSLQDGQEKLGGVTVSMLSAMTDGQQELMSQQMSIKSSQVNINSQMSENMRMLVREKALIATGQKELSGLTEEILKKLVSAQKQLSDQEDSRKMNHQELIKDLSHMVEVAQSFQKQVDASTKTLSQLQAEAAIYFEATVDNLDRINSSISYLMTLLTQIRGEVDEKLGWIMNFAGGTEQRLTVLYTCSLHMAYFLVAAICILFLQAPAAARMALFICVFSNAIWELRFAQSLGFFELTAAVGFIATSHYLIMHLFSKERRGYIMPKYLKSIANGLVKTQDGGDVRPNASIFDPNRSMFQGTGRDNTSIFNSTTNSFRNPASNTSCNTVIADSSFNEDASPDEEDDLPDTTTSFARHMESFKTRLVDQTLGRLSRSSTPVSRESTPQRSNTSRASTPSRSVIVKPLCRGKTKNGMTCRLTCVVDTPYCRLHQNTGITS